MSKPIVRLTDGPGVDEDWTLDQIVRYARIRGYYLGENFTVQGSPMSMDDDEDGDNRGFPVFESRL